MSLEDSRRICKAEQYDEILEVPIPSLKRCLLFISIFDLDKVIY